MVSRCLAHLSALAWVSRKSTIAPFEMNGTQMSKLKNKEAKTRREVYDNEDEFFGIYTHMRWGHESFLLLTGSVHSITLVFLRQNMSLMFLLFCCYITIMFIYIDIICFVEARRRCTHVLSQTSSRVSPILTL